MITQMNFIFTKVCKDFDDREVIIQSVQDYLRY